MYIFSESGILSYFCFICIYLFEIYDFVLCFLFDIFFFSLDIFRLIRIHRKIKTFLQNIFVSILYV